MKIASASELRKLRTGLLFEQGHLDLLRLQVKIAERACAYLQSQIDWAEAMRKQPQK